MSGQWDQRPSFRVQKAMKGSWVQPSDQLCKLGRGSLDIHLPRLSSALIILQKDSTTVKVCSPSSQSGQRWGRGALSREQGGVGKLGMAHWMEVDLEGQVQESKGVVQSWKRRPGRVEEGSGVPTARGRAEEPAQAAWLPTSGTFWVVTWPHACSGKSPCLPKQTHQTGQKLGMKGDSSFGSRVLCNTFLFIVSKSRSWYWERLKAKREGGSRGWDGWMASPTQGTWVWASSGRKWMTGAWCATVNGVAEWLSDWAAPTVPYATLGKGRRQWVSGKLVCDRGQDLMWLGQRGRQGEWRQWQRGVLLSKPAWP